MTAAQLIAPATTISQNGAFSQPIRGGVALPADGLGC